MCRFKKKTVSTEFSFVSEELKHSSFVVDKDPKNVNSVKRQTTTRILKPSGKRIKTDKTQDVTSVNAQSIMPVTVCQLNKAVKQQTGCDGVELRIHGQVLHCVSLVAQVMQIEVVHENLVFILQDTSGFMEYRTESTKENELIEAFDYVKVFAEFKSAKYGPFRSETYLKGIFVRKICCGDEIAYHMIDIVHTYVKCVYNC